MLLSDYFIKTKKNNNKKDNVKKNKPIGKLQERS